ncbi:MAG: cytochrome c3 family protein [Nitrospinae bacterium]|nr:cytochrome c3 family protein [Nitrospinota bacterium]
MSRWVWGLFLVLAILGGGGSRGLWAQEVETGSCQECHLEEREKKLRDPVRDWQKSVHALHQVSCDGCHGGNPKAHTKKAAKSSKAGYLGKPEEEQIPDFCGQCHGTERESFLQGPHGEALRAGTDAPTCTACHGVHNIRPPSLKRIITEDDCSDCHDFADSKKVKQGLMRINDQVKKANLLLAEVWNKGMSVDPMRRELGGVKEEVEKLVHEMAVNRTIRKEQQLTSVMEKIGDDLSRLDREANHRRFVGMISIGFLLVALVIAIGYRRTLVHRD